jgi:hypothetical protein
MYTDWLMDHEDEWRDKDYVGTISYAAHTKQHAIHTIDTVLDTARQQGAELVAFYHLPGPMIQTAMRYHTPAFGDAWRAVWNALGYTDNEIIFDDTQIHGFYSHYWATTPALMREFCSLMRRLRDQVESSASLREIVWGDARYQGGMSTQKKMDMFGVPYYPLLPFVCERMPCLWFRRLQERAPIRTLLMS